MNELVSIVVPVYKVEEFIEQTIKAVQDQTYQNWELLFINDCSPDNSTTIIKKYMQIDNRIKLFEQEENGGAALARNRGIKEAQGRFISFLDSDDLWQPNKLEKQLEFIKKNNCAFSYTGYQYANEEGKPTGKIVHVPKTINYKQSLKNTTIFTSTVIFDLDKLKKEDVFMPNVRRGQDTATWWKVLKTIDKAYGLDENLSYYRRPNNSLSSNKFKALKRTWYLYRHIENLGIFKSSYYFIWYCFNAIKRRV